MKSALICLTLVMAFPIFPVEADPIILVTGGSFLERNDSSGVLSIFGTGGFSMTLSSGANFNQFGNQCRPCVPGETLDVGGVPDDVSGTFTIGGRSFVSPGEADTTFNRFMSAGIVPPLNSNGQFSAPFTFIGGVVFDPPLFDRRVELRGQGTVLVQLSPDPLPAWDFRSARFAFTPAVTPEPMTLLLVGSGVLAIGFRRRREDAN